MTKRESKRGRPLLHKDEEWAVNLLINIRQHEGDPSTRKPKAADPPAQIRRALQGLEDVPAGEPREKRRRRVRRQADRVMREYGIVPGEAAEPKFGTDAEKAEWDEFKKKRDSAAKAFGKKLRDKSKK